MIAYALEDLQYWGWEVCVCVCWGLGGGGGGGSGGTFFMTDVHARSMNRPSEAVGGGGRVLENFENLDIICYILDLFWLQFCCISNIKWVQ